jgi:spore coat protein CotF
MMPQNDKAIANECLLHQKYLADSYTGMARETACDSLFSDVIKICQEELQASHQIFNHMNQHGWYQVQNADQSQITKAHSQIQQMQMQ